jgi:hypothetical protein
MWFSLNEMIGKILLVGVVGGGAIYGGYKFVSGPPILRQKGDNSSNRYERQAKRQFERQMSDLHEDQSRRFNESMGASRSVGS